MAISIRALSRRFQSFQALDDISLQIGDGEFVALLGPSGSGKTTLLRILAGLDDPDHGEVIRDGEDLLSIDPRHRNVGLVFQHYALFAHMRVADNVAFGLRVRSRRTRPPRQEIRRRVDELLRKVQLHELAERYPAQLSGGQRQRVALARALAIEPSLLLLDEPFGALDAQVRVSLRLWLRQLHDELGITTVFVTHDQDEALELADRVVVMNRGRIEQVGTPTAIYQEPASPFVYDFIGRRGSLPVSRRGDHHVEVLGVAFEPLEPLPAEWCEGEAYLRPEQWTPVPSEQALWSARVLAAHPHGAAWRLQLEIGEAAWPVEAEWSRDVAGPAPLVGSQCGVRIASLDLFVAVDGALQRHRLRPVRS